MEPKKETLTSVDAAWWRMEEPTNLMMVTGFIAFQEELDRDELIESFKTRLLCYDRFRQRIVDDSPALKSPMWEDAEVDFDYHLVEGRLPGEGTYEDLRQAVSDLMSSPLDYTRPLWQMHLMNNFKEGSALIVRTHHAMADGMALISVILSMTADTPEASREVAPLEDEEFQHVSSSGLFKAAGNAINTLRNPSKLLEFAKLGGEGAMTTARLLMKKADPPTLFRGPLGKRKLPAWSRPIPLDDIKAIKGVTNGTVNDVLLTAMTGGLRRYMIKRGAEVDGLNFRAVVPVNLRPQGKTRQLGNQFGLVFLSLPVGIEDPLERLLKLKKRMDRIKNSPEAVVALGMLKAVGATPADVQKVVVNVFGAKSTAVMTNVPGPREPLYLIGRRIENLMFWVPQSGHVGLGVSILSYAGFVRLGVVTDAGLVEHPDQIIDGFYEELDDMMDLVRVVREDKDNQ